MSRTRWSVLSYLGAVSLLVGGLSACGDTGTAAPSYPASTAAQSGAATAAEQVASVDGSACPQIPDTVNINNQADLDAFNSLDCFTVERHLFVQDTTDIVDLSALHGLRSVGGYIGIADNAELTSAELPNLVKTGEGLVFEGNLSLASISAPALRYVKGNLHVFNNQALESAEFGWLISVGEDVIFAGNNAMTSLELPELATIMGQFIFEHSEVMTCLCLPNLVAVNGDFTVHFNPGLKSLAAPMLTTIWGDVTIERNAALEVFDMSCLEWVAGDLTVIYNHMLAQCSVEGTAASIAHIGGDVVASDNYAMCPEVPVTSQDVGCVECVTGICAPREPGDAPDNGDVPDDDNGDVPDDDNGDMPDDGDDGDMPDDGDDGDMPDDGDDGDMPDDGDDSDDDDAGVPTPTPPIEDDLPDDLVLEPISASFDLQEKERSVDEAGGDSELMNKTPFPYTL
ncbi:hypothetical protein [Bradymonas sediminis]|uniref:hypothetical protein n=1 Tax=Bradymonas sediminis TaxID=1548548 RepID=UPI0010605F90|nr:hypothetical protein [Bradymonas sediminis]TDP76007.1 hypothetical protein DFR33_103357 [Bradymonas sediminis]